MNLKEERRCERVCGLVNKLSENINQPSNWLLEVVLRKERELYHERKNEVNCNYRDTFFYSAIGHVKKMYRR